MVNPPYNYARAICVLRLKPFLRGCLVLAFCLLLNTEVWGQNDCSDISGNPLPAYADTLSISGYTMLEVGNRWQFVESYAFFHAAEQQTVLRDTLLLGIDAFQYQTIYFDIVPPSSFNLVPRDTVNTFIAVGDSSLLFFNSDTNAFESFRDNLKLPFCFTTSTLWVRGGYQREIAFNTNGTLTNYVAPAIKSYLSFGSRKTYIHGIGFAGGQDADGNLLSLQYAKIGNTVYGTSLFSWYTILDKEPLPDKLQSLALTVYPNPFYETIALSFTLSKPQRLSIYVVDVLGRKQAILSDNVFFPLGNHILSRSLQKLSQGIYFVYLQNDSGESIARKIVLMK